MINTEEISGTEVVKSIKKKLWSKNVGTQRLCLELLETLTSNCEKVFSEVASEKVLEEMVKVIEDSKTDDEVVRRGFEMVRAWGQNDDLMYLPVFHQTYMVCFFGSCSYMFVICYYVDCVVVLLFGMMCVCLCVDGNVFVCGMLELKEFMRVVCLFCRIPVMLYVIDMFDCLFVVYGG